MEFDPIHNLFLVVRPLILVRLGTRSPAGAEPFLGLKPTLPQA